ncbi:hypothetical protein C0J52_22483, partial [Blattella germanica]
MIRVRVVISFELNNFALLAIDDIFYELNLRIWSHGAMCYVVRIALVLIQYTYTVRADLMEGPPGANPMVESMNRKSRHHVSRVILFRPEFLPNGCHALLNHIPHRGSVDLGSVLWFRVTGRALIRVSVGEEISSWISASVWHRCPSSIVRKVGSYDSDFGTEKLQSLLSLGIKDNIHQDLSGRQLRKHLRIEEFQNWSSHKIR